MIGSRGIGVGLLAVVLTVGVVVVVHRQRAAQDAPGGAASGGPVRTVFMGDSITQADTGSFGARPGPASWVGYAVGGDSPWTYVADVAVGGQTLAQMAARFGRDVVDRDVAGVVIMGGTNDVLQGLPLEIVLPDLRRMIEAAQAAGLRVWVVAPPPINALYAKPAAPMVEAQRALAAELGVRFVDVTGDDRLVDADGNWLAGLSFDGVHPTPAGAKLLATAILDRLS